MSVFKFSNFSNSLVFLRYNYFDDIGIVTAVLNDIIYVKGLAKRGMLEQVEFFNRDDKLKGLINYLGEDYRVGITLLGNAANIKENEFVKRLGVQPEAKAEESVLGKIIDCFSKSLDGGFNDKIKFGYSFKKVFDYVFILCFLYFCLDGLVLIICLNSVGLNIFIKKVI